MMSRLFRRVEAQKPALPPPRPQMTAEAYRTALIAEILGGDPRLRTAHDQIRDAIQAMPDSDSRKHQMTHLPRWLRTVAMFPDSHGELIDVASAPFYADALRGRGWNIAEVPTLAIDYEKDPLPFESERFDAALLAEVIEHFVVDPLYALLELNRVLKVGGGLVITTPNIASWFAIHQALNQKHPSRWPVYSRDPRNARNHLHAREYTVAELRQIVEAAGFKVTEATTMDYGIAPPFAPIPGYATEDRGETIFLAARKVGPPQQRAIAPIYLTSEPFTGFGV